MLCMERQLVLELKDIGRVGVTCPNCATQTIVDITKPETGNPSTCASCNKDFYPNQERGKTPLERLIAAIRDCHRQAKPGLTVHISTDPLKV